MRRKIIFAVSFYSFITFFSAENGFFNLGFVCASQEILHKMAERYASVSSYQDTGYIEETHITKSNKWISKKPFKTYFVRPNLFRFEWKAQYFPGSPWINCVLWSDGDKTFTYWEPNKLDIMKSLAHGILANAGISSEGTINVPCMLFNMECGLFKEKSIENILFPKEEVFNGKKCLHLKIRDKRGKIYEVWIERDSYLLRRLKKRSNYADFTVITDEIHEDIKINEKIEIKIFNLFKERKE